MPDPTYNIPDNLVYNPQYRALQDTDPAQASTVFNPLFLQIVQNLHALKRATDMLAGLSVDGVVPTRSALPLAADVPNGAVYLVQQDETRLDNDGNAKSTVYQETDGEWQYLRDYSVGGLLSEASIASPEGLFGMRYFEGKLQVIDGEEWIDVGGSPSPAGTFNVDARGKLSSTVVFGVVMPNTNANTLAINEGFAVVNDTVLSLN